MVSSMQSQAALGGQQTTTEENNEPMSSLSLLHFHTLIYLSFEISQKIMLQLFYFNYN